MATITDAIINLSGGTAQIGVVNEDIDKVTLFQILVRL